MAKDKEKVERLKQNYVSLIEPPTPEEMAMLEQEGLFAPPTPEELAAIGADSKEEKPSFGQQVMAPIKAVVKDPLAAGVAAVRGAQRSFTDIIPQGQEMLEAATSFPIVRGAELAAKGVQKLRGEPTAPLTSFTDMISQQRGLTKELEQRAPGVERGVELGTIAGQVAPVVGVAARGAASLGKGLLSKLNTLKAERLTKSMLTRARGAKADEFIVEAITQRPDEVKALLDKGDLSVQELANKTKDFLVTKEKELGKAVDAFRTEALADKVARNTVDPGLIDTIVSVKDATTLQGKSLLPKDMKDKLDLVQSVLAKGTISPSDTVKVTDTIDSLVTWGKSGESGSNIINKAEIALKGIRRELKNQVRAKYPEWVKADEAFSTFKDESKGIIRRLDSDGAESFVSGLMGAAKGNLRDRFVRAMDVASNVAPGELRSGELFLNELANIKAAQGIRAFDLKKADPIADNVREIVKRYQGAGALLGSGVGAQVGGWVGAPIGATVGGLAGTIAGTQMANPVRILNAASKAKRLSAESKALAKDLLPIAQKLGADGVQAALNMIATSRAAQELVQFTGGE